jgi:hypothetical protein
MEALLKGQYFFYRRGRLTSDKADWEAGRVQHTDSRRSNWPSARPGTAVDPARPGAAVDPARQADAVDLARPDGAGLGRPWRQASQEQ